MAELIEAGIQAIEEALGDYLCTYDTPCAAVASYDEGQPKPWRIADDYVSEEFASLEEAIKGAEAWADAFTA